MTKNVIRTDDAPAAIGPYSQAIVAGGVLYCSGQIGLDPQTGQLVSGGFEAEARQVFRNLAQVAAAAGLSLKDAVRLTVYVTNLAEFPRLNDIMQSVLTDPYPARATVEVSALPKGACVEIDMIAARA
ncbi:MAG TPA: Rid family detoxifying hydrolase [Candidatus Limnocylindrales bacterium]|nr:Rid family detoxifying hydrolase [Candidatus Limnocylindrales bacterium]